MVVLKRSSREQGPGPLGPQRAAAGAYATYIVGVLQSFTTTTSQASYEQCICVLSGLAASDNSFVHILLVIHCQRPNI